MRHGTWLLGECIITLGEAFLSTCLSRNALALVLPADADRQVPGICVLHVFVRPEVPGARAVLNPEDSVSLK